MGRRSVARSRRCERSVGSTAEAAAFPEMRIAPGPAMPSQRKCVAIGTRVPSRERRTPMQVVIRHHKGSAKLIDLLVGGRKQIEELLTGIDGSVADYLIRTADGGASVRVYENEAGTTESTTVATAFVGEHHPGVAVGPPDVIEGSVVIDLPEATRRCSLLNRGRGLTSTAATDNSANSRGSRWTMCPWGISAFWVRPGRPSRPTCLSRRGGNARPFHGGRDSAARCRLAPCPGCPRELVGMSVAAVARGRHTPPLHHHRSAGDRR